MSVVNALTGVGKMQSKWLDLDWEAVSCVPGRPGTTSLILVVVVPDIDGHVPGDLLSERFGFPVESRARARLREISKTKCGKRTPL